MTFALINGGKLHNVIAHNIIGANQKTESFVYRWLGAHTMFDVIFFPTFVREQSIRCHFKHSVDILVAVLLKGCHLKSKMAYSLDMQIDCYKSCARSHRKGLPVKTAPIENGPSPKRPHFRSKRPQTKKKNC